MMTARASSLLLDPQRRKVNLVTADQNNFLGFRRKDYGKLDSQDKGFRVWSDWPDLTDLSNWSRVQLKWTTSNTQTEVLSQTPVCSWGGHLHHTTGRNQQTARRVLLI